MDNSTLIVRISGESQGLVEALNDGTAALSSFSQKTDVILQQVGGAADGLLKKIEQNTGGKLLFLQKVTVAMHGIGKVFSTIGGAFSSYMKDANDANFAMTDEARQNAKDLEDSVNSLCTVAKSIKDEFLSNLTPIITGAIHGIATFVGWIRNAIVAAPGATKVIIILATSIGLVTVAVRTLTTVVTMFNMVTAALNPLYAAITAITSVLAIAGIAWYGASNATDVNTNALNKNAEAEKRLAEEKERAAEAERKKQEEAAKAAKNAVAASEKSLADSGKSSAQKEVERIDEEIAAFKENWHTRKGWLWSKKDRTEEEQKELDSMTKTRYRAHISGLQQRQDEIRAGLSHNKDISVENPESGAVRAAQDRLDSLRATGASAPEVERAEKAVKAAEMRFTQAALRSSGQEKEIARANYRAAKEAYENSGNKDDFQREALYKAMIDAQKRSQEADANFSRLAEENYKMHEVKMPEYEYKSVGGTFNAFAVAALGADIPKQQLEVLQQVAGKMDDIINNQQEAGVFA